MSILDALQVQKASQQSVRELAALPQNEIIRMAQMGQIPADVVPVIISEKARMAKDAANLQAASQLQQQGGKAPTVIEQAMQANAQSEAPAGVAALPTGEMFQGQNFQAGGIVAFEEGGDVEQPESKDLMRAFANVHKDKASGKDLEVLMAGLGIGEGSLGVNLSKISDSQRESLGKTLVAQYGTRLGGADVQAQASRQMEAPAGVYGLGATASYPLGEGRISAGINAMRTPERSNVTGFNVGYGGRLGPGQINAGLNIPMGGGQRPSGQIRYQMPFEKGGIVGYSGPEGSFVESPTGLKVLKSELDQNQPGGGPSSLAGFIAQYKKEMAPYAGLTPEMQSYIEARKKGAMSKEDAKQQQWMRLLQAGLGIMGGESPYALTNIGRGSQEALKGYGEDVAAQRAAKLADLKEAAAMAESKRAEERGDVAAGSKLYESYLDRAQRLEIARESQLGAKYADNYVRMRRSEGDNRPEEAIRHEGFQQFFKEYGYAAQRTAATAETAAAGQGVQLAGVLERYANQAQDSVDKLLGNMGSPESIEYRRLKRSDPEKAQEYRQSLITQRARELAATAQALAPAAGAPRATPAAPAPAAPSAAPQAPVALPKTEAELKRGTVYQTARGPATWDGTQFIPVR